MARHRRQASVAAEAANKQIAEQALADLAEAERAALIASERRNATNKGSSPLSSLGSNKTLTPGSSSASPGQNARSEVQQPKQVAGQAGQSTLMEQVHRAKAQGIDVEGFLMEAMKKSAKPPTISTPKKLHGGAGPRTKKPTGGPSPKGQPGVASPQTKKLENKPVATPPNKDKNKPNDGSTRKTPAAKNGPMAPPPMLVGNGNLQKRLSSQYLEDVPENHEQEREHKRTAQRQWISPGHIRCPLNKMPATTFFQEDFRKIYNTSETRMITDPQYTLDPTQKKCYRPHPDADSDSDGDEIAGQPAPRQISGFNGLPQYGPPPESSEDQPCNMPSDSFSIHQQQFQLLDERSKSGIELDEDEREEHRLHSTFMSLMGNQKKDIQKMKNNPLPFERFNQRFELTEEEHVGLALWKLKPARKKKADPPLFAEGTWHNSRRMEHEDATVCSFCTFDCDFGVSDSRVWLPEEASGWWCNECHKETMTSVIEWKTTVDANPELQDASHKNKDRLQEFYDRTATPPLKELADSGFFKFQALEQREVRKETLLGRRHAQLDKLKSVEFVQQYSKQVMTAFNGAGSQPSSIVPQTTFKPQRVSPAVVLATFPGEAKKRFQAYVHSMPRQQHDQFMAHLNTLEPKGQWELINQCSMHGHVAQSPMVEEDTAGRQAMAKLVGDLHPDQQQFMMRNMSPEARSHLPAMMAGNSLAGNPLGPSQTTNNETTSHNHQRRLSNSNSISTSHPSSHTTPTGTPNAQQIGIAAHGHQRRPSYTGLPVPSPQTMVNFGGAGNGQNNLLRGPGGDPSFAPMGDRGMAGNHNQRKRTTSGPIPVATTMPYPNPNASFPPNGWHMSDPGGSPQMRPSSFNQGTPGGYHQQMPQSPAIGPYGAVNPNYHGPPMNGPGGSPPMQPFMPNGQQLFKPQNRSNGTNTPRANMINETNKSPNRIDNGVSRTLVTPQGGAKQTASPATAPSVSNKPSQSKPPNSGNSSAPLQTPNNTKSMQVIELTRSGGTIGPTTFRNVNPQLEHHQDSHGQPVNGSVGNPPSCPANHIQEPKNPNVRPPPSGSNSQAHAPLVGLGISNGQTMMGGAMSNDSKADVGALTYPQQAQMSEQQSSAFLPTPRMSPQEGHFKTSTPHPAPQPSNVNSQSHTHSHPPVLQHAHTAPPNASSMAPPPHPERRRTMSQADTSNTSHFQQMLFCRGCPWRQIDITKARICEDCKAEKFKIITHRHVVFVPLHRGIAFEEGEGIGHSQLANTQKRTCMVCTDLATTKCIDCPLRLCTNCEVKITTQGKSSLVAAGRPRLSDDSGKGLIWTLIEVLATQRAHMRNDVCCFLSASHFPDPKEKGV